MPYRPDGTVWYGSKWTFCISAAEKSDTCGVYSWLAFQLEIWRMEILRYKCEHEDAVISAITGDPDWDMFTNKKDVANYRKRLLESITYVCLDNGAFCGYVRALLDDYFAVYISELFVVPEKRNRTIGRTLIAKVKMDFGHLTVYALSDEDAYYEKLGHRNAGSVYEICGQAGKSV